MEFLRKDLNSPCSSSSGESGVRGGLDGKIGTLMNDLEEARYEHSYFLVLSDSCLDSEMENFQGQVLYECVCIDLVRG